MPADLTELPLEALMEIEITSLSKKSQTLAEAPAAVFVITQEDIRRSGAPTIPEVLRMVPGLQVARITASQWAITARGFNGRFGNKLLVLMDGRSPYTPLFSGVFWEVQDTLLEDVERIEVIRGPGASLWGANAVNGVINIITKSAADTQGGLLTAGAGSEACGFGGFRYGGHAGDQVHYRFCGKYIDHDAAEFPGGESADDDWDFLRGGFRADAASDHANRFMLQGEIYDGTTGDTAGVGIYVPPYEEKIDNEGDFTGAHLLGRWEHELSTDSDLALQLYFDQAEWDAPLAGFRVDTYDADFQHRFHIGRRQEIIRGLGYRHIRDELSGSTILEFVPHSDHQNLFSAFVQDEIELWPEAAFLTIGTKLEHNDFTGFEVQPSARLLYKADPRHSYWLAVSRAVRTPSRGKTDSRVRDLVAPPAPAAISLPLQPVVLGNVDFDSEVLWAYEIGYRTQPMEALSLDLALFYNDYDRLRSITAGTPELELTPPPPHLIVPTLLDNDIEALPAKTIADERKFKQILYNLLSNAVKFTPAGGRITLRSFLIPAGTQGTASAAAMQRIDNASVKDAPEKDALQITVADTGVGLKPEDCERIFEQFEQVDGTLSRKYEGTGLGLTLTRDLVHLHGGRIWVESPGPDQGTRFHFILPTDSAANGGRAPEQAA